MLLIADGGSTKVDWVALDDTHTQLFKVRTKGLNPAVFPSELLVQRITENQVLKKCFTQVRAVYFYGAGCGTKKATQKLKAVFETFFTSANIVVAEDTLGAVYAASKGKPAIVAILGTGSNSCYFDGAQIYTNSAALGYMVMDEGSGNYFGKRLIRDYYYACMPEQLAKDFENKYDLGADTIKYNLYSRENPNAYLATFASFMSDHKQTNYIKNLIKKGFEEFFKYRILPYPQHKNVPIYFVGSIAYHFRDLLGEVAENLKLKISDTIQRPIEGLIQYHKENL